MASRRIRNEGFTPPTGGVFFRANDFAFVCLLARILGAGYDGKLECCPIDRGGVPSAWTVANRRPRSRRLK